MNKYKKLVSNSIIFAIGNFGSKIINIVMVPLYTFYLTTIEYGKVDLVMTTTTLLLPICSLCMNEAALRYSMDRAISQTKVLTNTLVVQLLMMGSLIFVYPIVIYSKMFDGTEVLLVVLLALQMFQALFSQFVRGIGKVKEYAISGILMTIVIAICNVVFLVILKKGIEGYLFSVILANIAAIFYLIVKNDLFNLINFPEVDKRFIREILKYSIPLIPNLVMWWVINGSSRFFIVFCVGASANGFFAVANKIPALLSTFTGIFNQAWQMSAIEEYDSEDKSRYYSDIFDLYTKLLFFGASGILLILLPLFKLVISPEFFLSWKLVPFLLLSVIYSSFCSFLGTNYVAAKQTTGVIFTSIICGLTNTVLCFVLIPLIGVNGAGISSAISFFVMFILRYFGTKKFVRLDLNKRNLYLNHLIFLLQTLSIYFIEGISTYVPLTILMLFSLYVNFDLFKKVIKLLIK